mmetsp:Transcript_1911/g.4893  ORF Transcript_1911/g.4893 Transcript_1911/m.4893 type:complete len:874 (-) Transcript_1911:105-2726(-)
MDGPCQGQFSRYSSRFEAALQHLRDVHEEELFKIRQTTPSSMNSALSSPSRPGYDNHHQPPEPPRSSFGNGVGGLVQTPPLAQHEIAEAYLSREPKPTSPFRMNLDGVKPRSSRVESNSPRRTRKDVEDACNVRFQGDTSIAVVAYDLDTVSVTESTGILGGPAGSRSPSRYERSHAQSPRRSCDSHRSSESQWTHHGYLSPEITDPHHEHNRQYSQNTVDNWKKLVLGIFGAEDMMSKAGSRANIRLDLQPVFTLAREGGSRLTPLTTVNQQGSTGSMSHHLEDVETNDHIHVNHLNKLQWLVAHPNSKRCIMLGIFGTLIYLLDATLAPLQVCNVGKDAEEIFRHIGEFTLSFWIFDFIMHFFIGYEDVSWIELSPGPVAKHYLKTWCLPDLLFIVLDIAFLVQGAQDSQDRTTKEDGAANASSDSLRLGRVVRFIRLGRLVRMGTVRLIASIFRSIDTEYVRLILQLLFLMLVILLLGHYVACGWVILAEQQGSLDENNWVTYGDFEVTQFRHRYAASLHWALAQFTPCTTNVAPHSFEERIFATCIILLAMFVFSSFISNMTTLFNSLRLLGKKAEEERTQVRHYLQEHRVSSELANRVNQMLRLQKENAMHVVKLKAEDLPGLSALPPSLKVRLQVEICQPHFAKGAPMAYLCKLDARAMRDVACLAIREISVMPLQDVFEEGAEAKAAYCLVHGECRYNKPNRRAEVKITTKCPWVADVGLFIQWRFCSRLGAMTICSMMELHIDIYHGIISRIGGFTYHSMRVYAVLILQQMEKLNSCRDICDLPLDQERYEEVATKVTAVMNIRAGALAEAMDPQMRRREKRRTSVVSIPAANDPENSERLRMHGSDPEVGYKIRAPSVKVTESL